MAQKSKKALWITFFITIFWLTMIGLVIQREYFPYTTSLETNYEEILKDQPKINAEIKKEYRKMKVYYGDNKVSPIGEINSIMTSLPDGTYELSTRAMLEVNKGNNEDIGKVSKFFSVPGMENQELKVGMETTAVVGPNYELQDLNFRIKSNVFDIGVEGKMKMGKLSLAMQRGEEVVNSEIQVPRGTVALNQFDTMPVPKNLQVGQKFHMRWFDPLTQTYRNAKSEVFGKDEIYWRSKKIPVHVIHTNSGNLKTVSWVNMEGEVVQYDVAGFRFVLQPPEKQETPNSEENNSTINEDSVNNENPAEDENSTKE